MPRRRNRRRTQAQTTQPGPSSAPAPPSSPPPPPIHGPPGLVRKGFTFQKYIDGTPPVNGRYMAMFANCGNGKRIVLPCMVMRIDEENRQAIVRATDGVDITIINIKVTIRNPYIAVMGKPIAPDILQAEDISLLSDNENMAKADFRINYLMQPSTWGEGP